MPFTPLTANFLIEKLALGMEISMISPNPPVSVPHPPNTTPNHLSTIQRKMDSLLDSVDKALQIEAISFLSFTKTQDLERYTFILFSVRK